MSVSKTQIQNMIKGYEDINIHGPELIERLKKQNTPIGQAVRAMFNDGMSQQDFAKLFGVDMNKKAPKVQYDKPSFLADVGAGYADIFGGVGQGVRYAVDKITGGNSYEDYTAKKKVEKDSYEMARAESGKGVNFGKFVGENVAMLPALALGKSYQGVKAVGGLGQKAVTAGKITAYNAGVSGALAGVGYQENSDDRAKAMALGAVGGAVAPVVVEPALKLAGKGLSKVSQGATRRIEQATGADRAKQIEIARQANDLVNQGAKEQGIKLTKEQRKIAYNTAKDLLNKGQKPDSNALVRKSVLDSHNIQGSKAQVTGNHIDWAYEKEFAKRNNDMQKQFNQNRDDLSAMAQKLANDTGQQDIDTFAKMQNGIETMNKHHDHAKQQQKELYNQAKTATGNDLVLDWQNGLPKLQKAMRDKGFIGHYKKFHDIIKGNLDENGNLTLLGAENAKKALNEHFSKSGDSINVAINQVKQHLDNWIDNANLNGTGDDAMGAWAKAKNAYKEHAKTVDDIPFFKASINGLQPDQAFDKYVVRGNVADIKKLRAYLEKTGETQVLADLQGATIGHILAKTADVDGKGFSYAKFATAMNSINDNRLTALLNDEQLAQLREIRKVANILLKEPADSPVNRSNTGNALFSLVMNLADGVPKTPLTQAIVQKGKDLFDTVEFYKINNGKIPTITARQKTLLERAGISTNTIDILTGKAVVPTAIAIKQASDDTPADDYAMPDDNPLWDDDDWQDDEFLVNQPAEPMPQSDQWQSPFEQTPQQGLDFTAPQVADYLPSDFGSYGLGNPQDNPQDTLMSDTGGGFGMGQPPQESPQMVIQSGLASLIPPPQNPANMGNYESYVQNAVGRIMATPQMGFILEQMASDNPDYARIEKAQKSLSHTPEWKNFVQNLPDEVKQKVNGANILALLTNSQIHGNSDIFNPTF